MNLVPSYINKNRIGMFCEKVKIVLSNNNYSIKFLKLLEHNNIYEIKFMRTSIAEDF